MTPTTDPNVFIIEQSESRTVYQTTKGETWEIIGQCTSCGECEVGSVDTYLDRPWPEDRKPVPGQEPQVLHYQIWTGVPVGEPGACLDARFGSRLDIPVRPEMTEKMTNCSLSGRYLNGN